MAEWSQAHSVYHDDDISINIALKDRIRNDPRAGLFWCCKSCMDDDKGFQLNTKKKGSDGRSAHFAKWPGKYDKGKYYGCRKSKLSHTRRESFDYAHYYMLMEVFLNESVDTHAHGIQAVSSTQVGDQNYDFEITFLEEHPLDSVKILIIDENKRRAKRLKKKVVRDDAWFTSRTVYAQAAIDALENDNKRLRVQTLLDEVVKGHDEDGEVLNDKERLTSYTNLKVLDGRWGMNSIESAHILSRDDAWFTSRTVYAQAAIDALENDNKRLRVQTLLDEVVKGHDEDGEVLDDKERLASYSNLKVLAGRWEISLKSAPIPSIDFPRPAIDLYSLRNPRLVLMISEYTETQLDDFKRTGIEMFLDRLSLSVKRIRSAEIEEDCYIDSDWLDVASDEAISTLNQELLEAVKAMNTEIAAGNYITVDEQHMINNVGMYRGFHEADRAKSKRSVNYVFNYQIEDPYTDEALTLVFDPTIDKTSREFRNDLMVGNEILKSISHQFEGDWIKVSFLEAWGDNVWNLFGSHLKELLGISE